MTGKASRLEDYIEHLSDAIVRIATYVAGLDQPAFERSTLVQDAVIRNFEIIGEAARKITAAEPMFAQQHPHLRLDLACRMRNALIHGYDAVNLTTVRHTIHNDLPTLKQQITDLAKL